MITIAERLFLTLLATTEIDRLRLRRLILCGCEFGALFESNSKWTGKIVTKMISKTWLLAAILLDIICENKPCACHRKRAVLRIVRRCSSSTSFQLRHPQGWSPSLHTRPGHNLQFPQQLSLRQPWLQLNASWMNARNKMPSKLQTNRVPLSLK